MIPSRLSATVESGPELRRSLPVTGELPAALTLTTPVLQSDCGAPLLLPSPYLDRCRDAVRSVLFEDDARVLGVAGCGPEAATAAGSLAAGITVVLALDTGEPTVLVECDPDRPTYAAELAIDDPSGLVDWLRGPAPLQLAQLQAQPNAFVIPVGGDGNNAGATFYQLTQTDLVARLRRAFRNVVLSLPPVDDGGRRVLATHLADRILLAAAAGRSGLGNVEEVVRLLDPERVQGVVLTDYRSRIPSWLRRVF